MDMIRRTILKGAGATSILAGLLAAGLLRPTKVYANDWHTTAFGAGSFEMALKSVGGEGASTSNDLIIDAPDLSEDGMLVTVKVTSNIPGTTSIAIMVKDNPLPLSAFFEFSNGAEPFVAVPLRFRDSSRIHVVAKAGGKTYRAQKEVRITVGGCGA